MSINNNTLQFKSCVSKTSIILKIMSYLHNFWIGVLRGSIRVIIELFCSRKFDWFGLYMTIYVIFSFEALTNTTYNGIGVTEFWPVLRHIFHKKFRIFFIFRGNQKIFSHLFIVRQTQISITAWSEWISYNIWWRKQFLRCY